MKKNIFLIGFSGIGKTTIGLAYAKKNKMNFISQDYVFQKLVGMSVKEYTKKNGPTKTKTAFDNVLKELIMACQNTVIDCGGGTSNTEDFKNQVVVMLSSNLDLIRNRYKKSEESDENRFAKFLSDEKLEEIHTKKQNEYKEFANYIVEITENDSIEDVVKKMEDLNIKE